VIGEAWLFALGVCGSLLFLAGVLHIPINALTAAVCVLIAIGVSYRTRRVPGDGSPAPGTRYPLTTNHSQLASALTLLPLLFVLYAAAFIPLHDFDGRAFWLLKAKGIAHDHAISGPFFHDQQVTDPRNDYPLLMPLNGAVVFLLGRTYDDTAVRWLYMLTFIAFVLFVRARLGAWPAAILAWIPQFAVVNEGGALSAYNDIPLAAFVAAAYFEVEDGRAGALSGGLAYEVGSEPDRRLKGSKAERKTKPLTSGPFSLSAFQSFSGSLRFGCWLAYCALTKNEGLPLAFILLVAGALVFRRRIAAALVPFGLAVAALFVWKRGIPHGGEEDLGALLPTLPHQLHRLPGAISGFAQHLVTPPWGLFWIAVFAALAWQVLSASGLRRAASGRPEEGTSRLRLLLAPFVIGAAFALYIAVYTVTTWVQIDLINSSADRVLMHVVGPGLFALARWGRRLSRGEA
jgi:hypothetical protein